ncbi:Adenine deaminase [Tolypocladium ophioglossoides CBS 100239]|uniref:Adenine deaminase n=1 Tax=Tolypocladium ophioglossoides (strain CBS 100239) TaxID=1163406 RepID=A0A0L0NKD9_TOLOC|nr:Adenine deaminase [Tolypocladium ophioglossoides CBS 100239]
MHPVATMCKSPLHNLLTALPKRRPPPDPAYTSTEALLARYGRFTCLDDFLHYYLGMGVLVTADDFEALAWAYFVKATSQRVRHAEVFFDPKAHTARGVAYDVVVQGLLAAKRRAESELGMTVEYIVCILRHLPLADSHVLVDTVLDRGHLVDGTLAGFGMVSSEKNFPPELFADIYSRVAKTGTRLTTHAGEEAGPESIAASLAHLGVTRIDHGCRVQDTFALSVKDWAWIARGAVEGSWCGEERKQELTAEVDAVLREFGHADAAA